jgi:hypothetical protein
MHPSSLLALISVIEAVICHREHANQGRSVRDSRHAHTKEGIIALPWTVVIQRSLLVSRIWLAVRLMFVASLDLDSCGFEAHLTGTTPLRHFRLLMQQYRGGTLPGYLKIASKERGWITRKLSLVPLHAAREVPDSHRCCSARTSRELVC